VSAVDYLQNSALELMQAHTAAWRAMRPRLVTLASEARRMRYLGHGHGAAACLASKGMLCAACGRPFVTLVQGSAQM